MGSVIDRISSILLSVFHHGKKRKNSIFFVGGSAGIDNGEDLAPGSIGQRSVGNDSGAEVLPGLTGRTDGDLSCECGELFDNIFAEGGGTADAVALVDALGPLGRCVRNNGDGGDFLSRAA